MLTTNDFLEDSLATFAVLCFTALLTKLTGLFCLLVAPLLSELLGIDVSDADLHPDRGFYH